MQLDERGSRAMKLARVGYEGYCAKTGWKSAVTGDDLPQWDSLPAEVRNAWWSAAMAIMNDISKNPI